jgi:hypothetical protein
MSRQPTGRSSRPLSLVAAAPPTALTLPAWKAFAVQFSLESGAPGGAFSGRIEHLHSGRRARFASPDELLAVLRQQLRALAASST